ncbi:MAG TPA: adenylate/guanylate cyclase domain-containing protein [Roseiarcus sp.]|jgi:adenylate cyclase
MTTERPGPSRLLTGAFLAAALIIGGSLGALEINGVASALDRIENLTLDWRFLLAGARPAPAGVAIVAIDDETLSQSGGDAPTREMMARIVLALGALHPRSIAIDIAFLKPKDPDTDAELARALKATPAVVAAIGDFEAADSSGQAAEPSDLALAPKPSSVLWPIEAIRDAAQVGLANVSTDSSGVPRYIPMIYETPDGVLPSFALAAASQALEVEPVLGPDRIEIAGRSREMDLGYHMPVRFYGPEGSFRRISATQVLRGDLDPEALRGKVVVVGVTATGASDTFATPFDRVAPGAEVFATAIGNLLAGDGLARTPSTRRIDAAAAVALPFVMIALMAMRRAAIGLVLASLVFVLWLAGIFLAFVHGYWLSAAAPLASALPLTVGFAAARSIVERRAGTRIAAEKLTLARFHSPLLLDHLSREPNFLEKPVRQDVAVMFLDLSGSTGAAEALGPEGTRDLFSAMQTLVEGAVTAHGGVVITYMGDGVLAVFGLPKPRSDDAARALATVEALRESMTTWLAELPPAARDRLDFRIGLNYGPAILSRLGSPTQQQITATGDTVNVASRLLEVAKQQQRRVVVTEDLFQAALPTGAGDTAGYAPLTVPIRGRARDLRVRMRN